MAGNSKAVKRSAAPAGPFVVEWVPAARISPAAYNPRVMTLRARSALRRAMERHGCVQPIVANRRTRSIVGGHQRYAVLVSEMRWPRVPVVWVDLPLEREKELNLALNGIQGEWDWDRLAVMVREMSAAGEFDPTDAGLSDREIAKVEGLLSPAEVNLARLDELPEAPKGTRIRRGDVIELGRHRLMCGDSTRREDVATLMRGERAALVFTDPPYAVDYAGGRGMLARRRADAYWDEMDGDAYRRLIRRAAVNARDFSDSSAALYLWYADTRGWEMLDGVRSAGWEPRGTIVWVKNAFTGSLFANYKFRYEPCFYGTKRGSSPLWFGPTGENNVWEYPRPRANVGHPTVKPTAVALRALRNSSRRGQIVADFFGGSGTTLVAAELLERSCCMMEISPVFCELICRRYEEAKAKAEPQDEQPGDGVAMLDAAELRDQAGALKAARRRRDWQRISDVQQWLEVRADEADWIPTHAQR